MRVRRMIWNALAQVSKRCSAGMARVQAAVSREIRSFAPGGGYFREGRKILMRCPKKMLIGLALTGALFLASASRTTFTQSSPTPQVTLDVPGEVLIGEDFTFTVKFKNAAGDIGYGPFIDLVLDAGGANIPKGIPPCSCDGITFVKAEMVGVVGGPIAITPTSPSPITTTPCDSVSNSSVPHPLASSGMLPLTVPPGGQLVTLELPFGSFDTTQPEITVEVTAHVSNLADAGTPLTISARGGFRYGTDPLDDPGSDPPIVSDVDPNGNQITDSTQWLAQAQTNPTVITVSKKYLGPEDENATGPNFISYYPLQYQITVDIANGQTVSNVTVTDCFPNNLAFQSVVSVSPAVPAPTVTPPPAGVPNNPPNNCLTVSWPSLTGAPGPDATVVVEFFIPENDADGNPVLPPDCGSPPGGCSPDFPIFSINDVKAEGDWTPLDPCDPSPTHVVSDITAEDHKLLNKCLAIQKSVSVVQDTGDSGPTPGDTLQYTLSFQISDFRTFGDLRIKDILSDGQTLSSTPIMLTVTDQFGTTSGQIPASAIAIQTQCDSGAPPARTFLTIDVSGAMSILATNAGGPARHLQGILTGGHATTPTSPIPATGQIVFQTVLDDEYACPVGPGDSFVDKDDPLDNFVRIIGSTLDNITLTPTGFEAEDCSGAGVTIVSDTIKKTVYAVVRDGVEICGPNSTPCPNKPQVAPGDQVTFRIEKVIPSSDAENLTIQDWLPLPIFDVDDPDANGMSGPAWSFTSASCGIPTPGTACLGPTDTLTSFTGPPTLTQNVTTNSLTFDYGTFNDPMNTPRKIDLLFTVTATNDPFADGLFLTNEARECEDNTFGEQFCQVAIAQVQVKEPALKITKGIVAADNSNAVFSPAPPPSGTFDPPGSTSCPRFSGTISSDNLSSLNLDSDVSNVDANDCVTFAIVVENTGGFAAYDVRLRDIFPRGPTDIPNCFVPDFNSLCVTDGTGASVPFTMSPGGFGSIIITLQNPLPGLDPNNPGQNIIVITFDACIIPDIQPHCCENAARLENYASTPGGPNFVDAGFGGPFEDTAEVCILPQVTKCIVTTSEAHTQPDNSGSGTPQVAIGEIIRYRLVLSLPEGTSPNFQVQDFLPAGLTYLDDGTTTLAFVSDMPITSSTLGTQPHVSGKEASCVPPNPPATFVLPASAITGGPFAPGTDPVFNLGTLTNSDNDADQEFVILEFNALVNNVAGNQDGVTLNNRFGVLVDGNQVATSPPVQVLIVEPFITLNKEVIVPPTNVGATVTYRVSYSNTGTATAFEVRLLDVLPSCLRLVPPVPVPGSLILTGGAMGPPLFASTPTKVDVTIPVVPVGGGVQFDYQVVLGECECDETINTATVTWTSLPGPNGTVSNPTGSATPGASGDPDGERNGSGGVNDYVASATANLCPDLMITKMAIGDFMAGQTGLYVIQVTNVGNGPALPPVTVTDTLPPCLTLVFASGTGWSCTPGPAVTCTYTGPAVPPGGSFPPINLTVLTDPSCVPTVGNCAEVSSPNDINPANNQSCVTVDVSSPPECLLITNEEITCNPDGTFTYTFDLTNLSPFPAAQVRFNQITPAGATVTPNPVVLSPPVQPGQITTVTVTIGGASSGETVCFLVSIHDELGVNCCTPDVRVQKCIVLPPCTGEIHGMKWNDLDGDGEKDPGEPSLPGWTIELRDNQGNVVATTTTDEEGNYWFMDLDPGTYTVAEVPQPDWTQTFPLTVTYTVELAPGQVVQNLNFGNTKCEESVDTVVCEAGRPDDFDTTDGPEPSSPSPALLSVIQNCSGGPLTEFDVIPTDRCFGHTFSHCWPADCVVVGARLTVRIRGGESPLAPNDAIWFREDGVPVWGMRIKDLTGGTWGGGQTATLTLNLASLPPATLSPKQGVTNILATLQDGDLDVFIQDDTGVDFMRLEVDVCCPGPGCVPPPSGMVAWWPLDETSGTTANDLAGFPNNGAHQNGPTPTPGMVAGALSFDGNDDHVRVPDQAELNVGTGNFTLDTWVRTTASQGVVVLVDKRSGPTPLGYSLYLVDGRLGFQMANGSGSGICTPSPQPGVACVNYVEPPGPNRADGQWHHVAAVVDRNDPNTGVRLYVDGVQVHTGPPMSGNLDNTSDLYLGVRTPGMGGGGNLPGDLDEVEIFNRALSASEIQAIFNAGSAGKCKKGTICGMKWNDLDGDGVKDPGEPGLQGWTIQLTDTQGNVVATTTTDADGNYCFMNLDPGTYTVSEVGQPGWMQTSPPAPGTHTVTLAPGQVVEDIDFGNQEEPGQICVVKFADLDGDGVQDSGEPLLGGWMFTVTDQNNNPIGTITTSQPGTPPACLAVPPGTYTVTEQVQPGWTPTTQPANSQTATVQPGQTVTLTFGNQEQVNCDLLSISTQSTGEDCCWQLTVNNGHTTPMPFFIQVTAMSPVTITQATPASGWTQTPTTGFPVTTVTWSHTSGSIPTGSTPLATICLDPGGALPQVLNVEWLDQEKNVVCTQQLTFDCPPEEPCQDQVLFAGDRDDFGEPGPRASDRGQFDQAFDNSPFRHTFQLNIPRGMCVTQARLTVPLRAIPPPVGGGDSIDDGFSIRAGTTTWCASMSDPANIPSIFRVPCGGSPDHIMTPAWNPGDTGVFTFDLSSLPGTGTNLLSDMSASGALTVSMQDDTQVDWIELSYTVCPCSTICGMKWNDLDGDGVKDPGEPGLQGWTIQLTDAQGNVVATTTTDADGNYCFTDLGPGTYTVSEVLQPGWTQTFPPSPGTHMVTLAPGQVVEDIDFGNRCPLCLPDLVVRGLVVVPPIIPRENPRAVVSFRIVNLGEGDAPPAQHEIQLVGEGPAGPVEIRLAVVETETLPPGGSQRFNVPIIIPPEGLELFEPRIRVIADVNQDVEETNEENNTAEFPIRFR